MDTRSILNSKESSMQDGIVLIVGLVLVVIGGRVWYAHRDPEQSSYILLLTGWLMTCLGALSVLYAVTMFLLGGISHQ